MTAFLLAIHRWTGAEVVDEGSFFQCIAQARGGDAGASSTWRGISVLASLGRGFATTMPILRVATPQLDIVHQTLRKTRSGHQ